MNKILLHNRYRLNDIAGEGGLGVVYKGFDTWVNKPVAIKMLKDLNSQQAFVNEYKWQSKLNAEWIVKAHALHEDNQGFHAVYEWLDGVSLDKAYGTLKYSQIIDIIKHVVNIQEYLKYAGVIHNDIKPANLFYLNNETGNYLKIGDFSFAMKCGKAERVSGGSPYYMAPELIARGMPAYETDLYSIGIILLELLAGKKKAYDIKNINAATKREKAISGHAMLGGNRAIVSGIARLLSLNPEDRHSGITLLRREVNDIRVITERRNISTNGGKDLRVYGREKEIDVFNNLINGVKGGNVMVLHGEAGIGKSTLIQKYENICRGKGWLIFNKVFEREKGEDICLDKLKMSMVHTIRTLYPEISIMLKEHEGAQNSNVLIKAVEAAVRIHPMLVCFDDYYKANETEKAEIANIIALARQYKNMYICLTTRSLEELNKIQASFLELCPLDRHEIRELCRGSLKNKIDCKTVEAIYETSRGNPFWADKACRDINKNAGQNKLVSAPWVGGGSDETVAAMLKAASVLGVVFDKNDLMAITEESDFEKRFAYLVKGDYFYCWAGNKYHWRHDIIKEHYYNALRESDKRELHNAVADYLESKYKDGLSQINERLALHYYKGCNRDKALKYLMLLGAHKEKINANNEGIEVYGKSLELLEYPLNTEEYKMKLECLNQMADLYSSIGDYTKFIEIANQANKLLPFVSDPELTVRTLNKYLFYEMYHNANFRKTGQIAHKIIQTSGKMNYQRGKVLGYTNLGITYKNRGMYKKALNAYFKGYRIAHKLKLEHLKPSVLGNVAIAYFYAGDMKNAETYFIKTIKLKEKLGLLTTSYEYLNLGELYADTGNLPKAEAYLSKAVTLKQKEEDMTGEALALLGLARISLIKDPAKVPSIIYKADKIDEKLQNKAVLSGALHVRALFIAQQGKYSKAVVMFDKSRSMLGDADLQIAESLIAQAEVEVKYGQLNKAKVILGRISKDALKSKRLLAKYYKINGEFKLRNNNYSDTLKNLKKGLICAIKTNNHIAVSETRSLLAKCQVAQGNYIQAKYNSKVAWKLAVKYHLNMLKPDILTVKADIAELNGKSADYKRFNHMAAEIKRAMTV